MGLVWLWLQSAKSTEHKWYEKIYIFDTKSETSVEVVVVLGAVVEEGELSESSSEGDKYPESALSSLFSIPWIAACKILFLRSWKMFSCALTPARCAISVCRETRFSSLVLLNQILGLMTRYKHITRTRANANAFFHPLNPEFEPRVNDRGVMTVPSSLSQTSEFKKGREENLVQSEATNQKLSLFWALGTNQKTINAISHLPIVV